MFPDKLKGIDGWKRLGIVLAGSGLLAFASCSSDNLKSTPPNTPFAENAPKTKEEADYYQDVYSGDWKKDEGPMGVMGIGKKSGSLTPPPHWGMAPPSGAKTMEQLYQENYQRQVATGSSPSTGYPNATAGRSVQNVATNPTGNYSTGNYSTGSNSTGAVNGSTSSSAAPTATTPQSTASPTSNSGSSPYPTYNGYDKITDLVSPSNQEETAEFGEMGETILRGQEPAEDKNKEAKPANPSTPPDEVPAEAPAESTGGKESPLTVDPKIAEPWRYFNRRWFPTDPSEESGVGGEIISTPSSPWPSTGSGEPAGPSVSRQQPRDPREQQSEYIGDGGDRGGEAIALPNWDVRHLEPEDTIAHFDTTDGRILVEPSNRVKIYSPRFGSIRQVTGPSSRSQNVRLAKAETEIGTLTRENKVGIDVRTQEERTRLTRGNLQATGTTAKQPGGSLSSEEGLISNTGRVQTADVGDILKEVVYAEENKAILMDGSAAATAWGESQGVSVEIEKVAAQGNITLASPETIYSIDTKTKTSQLSFLKVASKKSAAPGELVEFTLRYQNVGNQPLGNITILDSLSPRLEYVPDSAKSSKNANLIVKTNEVGSLLLRFEVTEPLEPNDFGVLSFLCKVR